MKKVYLCTDTVPTELNPYGHSVFNRIINSAKNGEGDDYRLTSDAESADLIVFVEPKHYYQTNLLHSSFYAQHRAKTIVFSQQDHSIPRIPGIYNRIPRGYHDCGIYEYGFYAKVFDFEDLEKISPNHRRRYLFSFIGNGGACRRVRQRVLNLKHKRCLLVDSRGGFQAPRGSYEKVLAESQFVLCPRGLGPSSFRLFETMRAGRVPVIISDEWRPISGVDWDRFAIRVPESDIAQIPSILEERQKEALEMGVLARRLYQDLFSSNNAFSWIAMTAARLLDSWESNQRYIYRGLLVEGLKLGLVRSVVRELASYVILSDKEIRMTRSS